MLRNRLTAALVAFATISALSAQQRPRITQPVDNTRLQRRSGTIHPSTGRGLDLGRAAANLPMERMVLQLNSSLEQQAELAQLIDAQHDPASPRFQQWLTPEEFGERFGPAQADVDAVTTWLEGQGFHVDGIARGRRAIEFSGTVAHVERAFHTEMRHYDLNGERHIANARDIAIPLALGPVVRGIASLHDFRSKPLHRVLAEGAEPVPLTNLSGGAHGLSPYDFATIYNVTPLWNSSFDGTGQSVAISGRTNIRPTDAASFRSMFGLPANAPQVILNGADPGIVSSGEEMEADLDVQWSGAVAKGATIKFIVSKSTNASDGVDLSNQYIVNNNVSPVMSVSFGACEAAMGMGGNSFYNALWQQAAAQGISVFISSGDSGSAGCDNPGSTSPATHGLGVNGLASTPYNVAVGGTQFTDTASPATYWNAGNDAHLASAKSYIPETSWNESSYTAGATTNNLYAGSGGVSAVWATPSWQTGSGVPTGDPGAATQHHRYLPDVSLAAAGHDVYLVIRNGGLYMVGGTSASSPALAGLMAIVDQYTGGRNGNPNTRFYSLAAQSPAAFHDVTTGTIAVPCAGGSSGCSTAAPASNVGHMNGFPAGAGYDLATGLGSVDAYAMALNWGSRPPSPPAIASLHPNPMTASNNGQGLTFTGTGFVPGATVSASYTRLSTNLTVGSASATQIVTSINVGTTARVWSINVTNPNGLSASASLTVNAPVVNPAITSLTPNPMTGLNGGQVLTINGSGFVSGNTLKVIVGYPGFSQTLSGGQIAFVSSGQVLALVNVGTAARTWTVQVVNPSGLASNSSNLTVTAPPPPPAIASLTPNPMTKSASSQTLMINGSGFQAGPGLRVVMSTQGSSTTLQGVSITPVSATQLKVTVNVGNAARTWTVQVLNPDNQASNAASLTVK